MTATTLESKPLQPTKSCVLSLYIKDKKTLLGYNFLRKIVKTKPHIMSIDWNGRPNV